MNDPAISMNSFEFPAFTNFDVLSSFSLFELNQLSLSQNEDLNLSNHLTEAHSNSDQIGY